VRPWRPFRSPKVAPADQAGQKIAWIVGVAVCGPPSQGCLGSKQAGRCREPHMWNVGHGSHAYGGLPIAWRTRT
jgi:hypothetical protein